jgi:hypothetical protein
MSLMYGLIRENLIFLKRVGVRPQLHQPLFPMDTQPHQTLLQIFLKVILLHLLVMYLLIKLLVTFLRDIVPHLLMEGRTWLVLPLKRLSVVLRDLCMVLTQP